MGVKETLARPFTWTAEKVKAAPGALVNGVSKGTRSALDLLYKVPVIGPIGQGTEQLLRTWTVDLFKGAGKTIETGWKSMIMKPAEGIAKSFSELFTKFQPLNSIHTLGGVLIDIFDGAVDTASSTVSTFTAVAKGSSKAVRTAWKGPTFQ